MLIAKPNQFFYYFRIENNKKMMRRTMLIAKPNQFFYKVTCSFKSINYFLWVDFIKKIIQKYIE